jgi:hypothetical protein
MSGINIPIKKAGFPVKIGDVELWFDDSIESISDYWIRDEKAKKDLENLYERIEKSGLNEVDETNINKDKYDETVALKKEELRIKYDALLGEGAFQKIYENHSDVRELIAIYEPIEEAISRVIVERMESYEAERKKEFESKKEDYLNKKQKKK